MRNTLIALSALVFVFGTLVAQSAPAGSEASTPQPKARSYRPLPPPENFSPPVIACEQPDYDWGTVIQGEKVRHDYVIMNKGGSPLVIQQVRPSCGCTMAGKPEKPIAPGQTGIVTLEIDTKRLSAHVKKTAAITSNALPSPFTISIGGNIENLYTIDPQTVRLDVIQGLPVQPAKVILRRNPNAKTKFSVKEVRGENQIVTTKVTEVTPGDLYEIAVGAELGEDQKRYYYERVLLTLGLENGKVFDTDFAVSITVKQRIDVQPRTTVYFNRNETKPLADASAQPVTKTLDIVSLGGADHTFNITSVASAPATPPQSPATGSRVTPAVPEAGPNYFDTKVETVTPGKHYRLQILMSKLPQEKLRTVRERFVIQTDDPTVGELSVTAMAAVY